MDLKNSLEKRPCPVCKSSDDNQVVYRANIDETQLDNLAFSSRKLPEFMNLTMVCCPTCNLLYAPWVPTKEFLQKAYRDTGYESGAEALLAAKSYAFWLKTIVKELPDCQAALEVGAGNGAFLEHLLLAGFKEVIGVEPSMEAISNAPIHIKKHIHIGMFNAKDFPANHFSLITIFQTLEHIDDPAQFFEDAFHLLKPGGILLMVAHNYRHWLMRLLGRKSPIIDIEHLQLFCPKSIQYALKNAGFQNVQIRSLRNVYPLHYWFKLLPLPALIKKPLLHSLKNGLIKVFGKINLGMKFGNNITWASK